MKNNSLFIQRILPSFFLILGLLFLIIGGYFLQKNFNETKYLFISISILVFCILLFEFFNSFDLKIHWILLLILLNILAFLFSMHFHNNKFNPFYFYQIFLNENSKLNDGMIHIKYFVKLEAQNFLVYLFAFLSSSIYYLIKLFSIENVNKKSIFQKSIFIFIVIIMINFPFKLLPILILKDPLFVLLIFGLPAICDTSAFFIGKSFGHKYIKQKLAPSISPKKTWEGAIGGFIFGALFVLSILFIGKSELSIYKWTNAIDFSKISIVIILPIVAIIGDLFFSAIKRVNNIKDFSRILLDHGGFLDRFDSIIFVSFFAILYLL
ncbi:hypothetical protein C4M96_03615 [Mycoplasmopsis pullorum]|uniref:phosphatidate cytidylyltransferase n=2 Tax=Mycoplasmopsis pullorum TaxID=48003 RepID=UPI00111B2BFD|nr:phosphatidate cytidylyltransferase [Mycoplasmopsis pullorum]TNK82635.1 hypothetical protein C4M93_03730 [Mycoplasmopsis pullorum]TNK91727.1 hypothetical protein C4M96_03615 [Mycoplasmopsis pullorum]